MFDDFEFYEPSPYNGDDRDEWVDPSPEETEEDEEPIGPEDQFLDSYWESVLSGE